MGIATYPAGVGPAGHDPPTILVPFSPTEAVAARFDPDTKTFILTTNGELLGVHPVDQAVALRLGIQVGSLGASPRIGLNLQRIKRAPREAMQATVDDAVRVALEDMILAGDIALLGSPLWPDARGRPLFFVDYRNLRIPSNALARRVPGRLI